MDRFIGRLRAFSTLPKMLHHTGMLRAGWKPAPTEPFRWRDWDKNGFPGTNLSVRWTESDVCVQYTPFYKKCQWKYLESQKKSISTEN